ncbi:cytochrome P450 family protein [Aphelenchoides avenae]|nr:cytochrome P450 family protein [Aphelenchus avenae]
MVEAFRKDGDAHSGRVASEMEKYFRGSSRGGIAFVDGDKWKEQKRFVMQAFRSLGVGKADSEKKVLNEVRLLLTKIEQDLSNDVKEHNVAGHLDVGVGSIIASTLCGANIAEDPEEFSTLSECLTVFSKHFAHPYYAVSQLSPWLALKLPIIKDYIAELMHYRVRYYSFFQRQIEAHLIRLDDSSADDEPDDDLMYAFLRETVKNDANNVAHHFT